MEEGIKKAEKENLDMRCDKVKWDREKKGLEESLDGSKSECRMYNFTLYTLLNHIR